MAGKPELRPPGQGSTLNKSAFPDLLGKLAARGGKPRWQALAEMEHAQTMQAAEHAHQRGMQASSQEHAHRSTILSDAVSREGHGAEHLARAAMLARIAHIHTNDTYVAMGHDYDRHRGVFGPTPNGQSDEGPAPTQRMTSERVDFNVDVPSHGEAPSHGASAPALESPSHGNPEQFTDYREARPHGAQPHSAGAIGARPGVMAWVAARAMNAARKDQP